MIEDAIVASHGQTCRFYGSDSLSKREDLRLPADDFKPGSHLVAGELVKRRICPSGRLEGEPFGLTSQPEPFGESSVDPRHGSEFLPSGSGVSEYPPHISRADWGVDAARSCKVS